MKTKRKKIKLTGAAKRIAVAKKNMKIEDKKIKQWKESQPKMVGFPVWEYKKELTL